MTAQRVVFRPPVSLAVAERLIRAALDDEGLRLVTRTAGARPALWGVRNAGALTVYLDPAAVIPKGAHTDV